MADWQAVPPFYYLLPHSERNDFCGAPAWKALAGPPADIEVRLSFVTDMNLFPFQEARPNLPYYTRTPCSVLS